MWIEVFKTGTHNSSDGREFISTGEKMNAIAELYNGRVSESESFMAPLVLGHPKDNEPAIGWIERLGRRANKLVAKLKDVSPEIIGQIQANQFKKVSISLYPDLMLRHIGLLGAASPAVKGLNNVRINNFTEFENEFLEETKEDNHQNLSEKLKFLEETNRLLNEKLNQQMQEIKKQEFADFAEFIGRKNLNSMITPANSEKLIEILEIAHKYDSQNNSELTLESKIKDFISNLKPIELTKEFTFNDFSENSFINNFEEINTIPERMQLHDKAMKIKSANNQLSYEDAVIKALAE